MINITNTHNRVKPMLLMRDYGAYEPGEVIEVPFLGKAAVTGCIKDTVEVYHEPVQTYLIFGIPLNLK